MRYTEIFENSASVGRQQLLDYFKNRWIDFDKFPEAREVWVMFVEDYLGEDIDNVEYDGENCAQFADWLEHRGWIRHWRNQDGANTPSWFWLEFIRELPRTTWMVHLTDYPNEISATGFSKGVSPGDIDTDLAFTFENGRRSYRHSGPGYSFGVLVDDEKELREMVLMHADSTYGYGRHAVLFQAGGVLAYHHGDKHNQTIFWGPSVRPSKIIPLTCRDSGWWTGAKRKSTYLPALVSAIRSDLAKTT